MAKRRRTPSANIHWRDVPASACVEDRGHLWVAVMGKRRAVVFWEGREAKQAQRAMKKRAVSSCAR